MIISKTVFPSFAFVLLKVTRLRDFKLVANNNILFSKGPFGDFGYGGRFPGHPSDFFPGAPMGFIGSHPGKNLV